MSKRCTRFVRRKQDAYDTPESAVLPLIPHLEFGTMFCEPCAGAMKLALTLETHGMSCVVAYDIEPRHANVIKANALETFWPGSADLIITNPPWTRSLLHPMIDTFRVFRPTWLLFDADWAHTRQAAPFLRYCRKIVSVGRVSWMENGISGFDNCAWYLFDRDPAATEFVGRAAEREIAA